MQYLLRADSRADSFLTLAVRTDIQLLGWDGFFISAELPLRASADFQTMAFGLYLEQRGEPYAVRIYLAQDIPDSNDYMLFLTLTLFPKDWSENDSAVLEELSEQIGMDLMAYLPW